MYCYWRAQRPSRGYGEGVLTACRVGFAVGELQPELPSRGHAFTGADHGAVGVADDAVATGEDGFKASGLQALAELIQLFARDTEPGLRRKSMQVAADFRQPVPAVGEVFSAVLSSLA